jgi:Arc/MetJ-type ribon-helix-helix transcriptional regulator
MAKVKITVTIDPDLVAWIDEQVERKIYSSRSHAIQKCVYEAKEISEP